VVINAEIIENAVDLDNRALLAKTVSDEMEKLIADFEPFLKTRAAKYAPRSDVHKHNELFSTAMIAFYEAIKGYDKDKGHFFPFAGKVVRNKLIDHVRGIYRTIDNSVPLETEDETQNTPKSEALQKVSMRLFENDKRRAGLLDEIEQFKAELASWKITMESLAKQSPKHKKQSETYKTLVQQILKSPDIIQTIQLKRYFPISAVSKISGLPQKKLERARTFIIASLIIKMGDYDYLSDYVDGGR